MRRLLLTAIITFSFAVTLFAQSGADQSPCDSGAPVENGILKEINEARTTPKKYVEKLRKRMSLLDGKILRLPGRQPFLTSEGAAVIDELIGILGQAKSLHALEMHKPLSAAAKAQLLDLVKNPRIGHTGLDGSDLGKRLEKQGVTGFASENITYRDRTSENVAMTMIVDDGVTSRPHRANVLNERFKYFGAACGEGSDGRFICVSVFSSKKKGSEKKDKVRSYR